ncbi:MAG TPA: Gfo/Idh/MocA family oxidoreductase [Planctomycetota bacterium]|nr:Gfo/Idh/MocA family oxidoreductase [Planctomycetota bacterium]
MNAAHNSPAEKTSRRTFIRASGTALAGATLTAAIAARSYAGENNTIKLALIGCGGRGTGAAANAMKTKGLVKLWAMADVFPDRLDSSKKTLAEKFADKIDVPSDRQFLGTDAFKKAIDALDKDDLVILATPPAFRPIHLEYAVAQSHHVFMEKSFAVDAPGIRRVLRAGEAAAAKNLKIAGGLMCRHNSALEETIAKIHDGAIGGIVTCSAFRMHGPVGFRPRAPESSELAHQIRNYSNFTWLNGSFILDWLIHNLDVCCWTKNAWPISAQGSGGRQTRTEADQMYDHFEVEYTFPDGTILQAHARHMLNCWGFFGSKVLGTKGSAVLGEGITQPKLYKAHKQSAETLAWEYIGGPYDPYQREHDLLFEAIRENKPYNETERCAQAALTGIMGRMAAESGQCVTREEALRSNLELAPGLDQLTLTSAAPINPDAAGKYPVAIPGKTKIG